MCCRLTAFKDTDLIGLHCSCWRVDRCGPVHLNCHPDADPGADRATHRSITARQRYLANFTRSSGVSPFINRWRPSIRFMPPCGQTSTSAVTPRSRPMKHRSRTGDASNRQSTGEARFERTTGTRRAARSKSRPRPASVRGRRQRRRERVTPSINGAVPARTQGTELRHDNTEGASGSVRMTVSTAPQVRDPVP
jgi:hypothetical protein